MEHGDPYLRELGEPTYLVIDPRVRAQPGPHGLAHPNHPQPTGLISSMPETELLCPEVCIVGEGTQAFKGCGENGEGSVILTLSPHVPQAEEEDEKGTAGGLLSSLEGPKMRPSLLMTRYLESWGAAKPFAHLSHVESPVSTSTPLPVRAPPS